jgi:peptidyl-prolyl cis-trans isomerase B (cyclophilin B)
MLARIALGLLLIFSLCSILACGGAPKEEPKQPEGRSINEMKDEIFAPAGAVEDEIFGEKAPETADEARGNEIPTPFLSGPASQHFTPSEFDPVTEAPWEDLIGVIETNKGTIKIKFYHDTAPRHVENFVELVRDGFYDGLIFHRYEAGFVIQGGDPTGTGQGGPGYQIPAEISDKYGHIKGAVAAARQSDNVNPERKSSGSQYYICLDAAPHLDGAYTVWGQVIEGMDIALKLRQNDVMEKITIREKK